MRGTPAVARLTTLLLFLALAGICAYWALQILAPRPAIAPSGSIGDSTAAANLVPSTQLFGRAGDAAPQAATPSNIQVVGIAESGPRGVAILTVDGRPAAAFAVNDSVTEGTKLVSVTLDTVALDQRGRRLELKAPERGSLSVLSSGVGKPRTTTSSSATPPVNTTPTVPQAPAQSTPQSPADAAAMGRAGFPPPGTTPSGMPPTAGGTVGQAPPGQPAFPAPPPMPGPGTVPGIPMPPGVTAGQPPGQLPATATQ